MSSEFYKLQAKSLQKQDISMDSYKGKTVLIVNTASKCGLAPQLNSLDKLYTDYKDKGFVVLGFPCNQFANQEPGDEESINTACAINRGVSFPMFSKVEVNGDNTHPVFAFLKKEKKGLLGASIKWNFTKFLINSEGKVVERFSPTTGADAIEKYLKKII